MIGAIAGDIIGSRFEGMGRYPKSKKFQLFHRDTHFTDDTVLTLATCEAILFGRDYSAVYKEYYARHPRAGYGSSFKEWAKSNDSEAYNSWGNGSAMRISPVAWAFETEEAVLEEADRSASATHNHPEGVRGAQAVALAILMLRKGSDKIGVESRISERFEYDLRPPLNPEWDVSCKGCVPQAFCAFLESEGFEDCIRRAIFKGGDSDTIAAIAGSMAEAYYGVPKNIVDEAYFKMSEDLENIAEMFTQIYINHDFQKPSVADHGWEKWFKMLIK